MKHIALLGALSVLLAACAKLPVINQTPVSLDEGTPLLAEHLMQQMPKVWVGQKTVFVKPFPDADSGQVVAASRDIEILLSRALIDSGDYWAERMRANSAEEADYVIGGLIRYEPDAEGVERYHLVANAISADDHEVVAQSDIWLSDRNLDYTATPSSEDSPLFANGESLKQQVDIAEAEVDTVLSAEAAQFLDDYGMVVEAQSAYDNGDYQAAKNLYVTLTEEKQVKTPETYGGLYTAYLRLDEQDKATESFAKLVNTAAAENVMPFKFQFASGSTEFVNNPTLRSQYPVWLSEIARYFSEHPDQCLGIHGHSSRSGARDYNLRLSSQRSEAIEQQLRESYADLKVDMQGFGPDQCKRCTTPDSSENAIDRRVEFVVGACS